MINLVAYLIRNKRKRKVLRELVGQKNIAVKIAQKLNTHRSTVSRSLIDLSQKGLVVCENPSDKYVRIYRITPKGKRVLRESQKILHEKED